MPEDSERMDSDILRHLDRMSTAAEHADTAGSIAGSTPACSLKRRKGVFLTVTLQQQ